MERRITVAAEDEPIENVLAQIFAGQDVSYEINGRSIVVTRRAVPARGRKGRVADAERRGARRQGRHDRGGDGRRQGDDHRRDDRHRRPLFAARVGGQSRVADFVRGLPDGRSGGRTGADGRGRDARRLVDRRGRGGGRGVRHAVAPYAHDGRVEDRRQCGGGGSRDLGGRRPERQGRGYAGSRRPTRCRARRRRSSSAAVRRSTRAMRRSSSSTGSRAP